MIHKKQKKLTFEKVFFIAVGLYVLFVSLLMVGKAVDLWLFVFFITVSLFSVYALYKIIYENYIRKVLWLTLLIEAFFATLLLYPAPLAFIADFVGIKCHNLLGDIEKCTESITFSSMEIGIVLMIPMIILAIFSYQKTK